MKSILLSQNKRKFAYLLFSGWNPLARRDGSIRRWDGNFQEQVSDCSKEVRVISTSIRRCSHLRKGKKLSQVIS